MLCSRLAREEYKYNAQHTQTLTHFHVQRHRGHDADHSTEVAPYWFVSRYEAAYNENVMQPLCDYQTLFAAKALILKHSRQDVVRYLDVPAFARGDLFYIQNLIYTIEAQ